MSALKPTAVHQRGAAALLVVIVLFFVLAMVTAYAGRSMVFEQRTSINNQRSTQAFEVAEAGLEFAISMLAGGRIDDACVPTNDLTKASFRERHLTNPGGMFSANTALRPTCMLLANGKDCSCPAAAAPALILPAGNLAPTFQVRFDTTGVTRPGVVRATSRGCSSIGNECYADAPNKADAVAEVSVLLGLSSALTGPPAAAITTRGPLNLNGGVVQVANADVQSRGITLDIGGSLTNAGNAKLTSTPGTPGSASIIESDTALSDLSTGDRMFVSVFGVDRVTYRTQPAVVRVGCASDCSTTLATAVANNPGRIIWVDGSVSIGSNLVLGTEDTPVMMLVHGDLTVAANFQLHGVIYFHSPANDAVWTTTVGSTLIQGAVIAERGMSITGEPIVAFNPAVLRAINLRQGSLVRIPGSWRDFAQGS